MPSVPVPGILDRIAMAGAAGLPYPESATDRNGLKVCGEWGIRIAAQEGRVRLAFDDDALVPAWIAAETPRFCGHPLSVRGFLSVDSTNEEALRLARAGAGDGTLVCAESQTAGRGRQGRPWHSPPGSGLYFSWILRPVRDARFWPLLAHVAAVGLCRALSEVATSGAGSHPFRPELKWPNDVLLSGRKAAGILLETGSSRGKPSAVVIGVGINVGYGTFPAELRNSAISVSEAAGTIVPRRKLLCRFLACFQDVYDRFAGGENEAILEEWKHHSRMWRDTRVWIREGDRVRMGVTAGLNEIGALRVRWPDGHEEVLLAGDVNIREACGGSTP